MSREQTHQAIVLKQSAFGEADEIITFFTRDGGKVRALAKAVKFPTSKLRHGLQPMFLVSVTLTASGKLPKVIGVAVADTFAGVAADPERVARWYVASELINKASPDEQKNEELFQLLLDFLMLLNQSETQAEFLDQALLKFKLELLAAIGLGVWRPAEESSQPGFFSNSKGGFFNTRTAEDAVPVTHTAWQGFLEVSSTPMADLAAKAVPLGELPQLITGFLAYHLEREIKSEKFL